MKKLLAIIFATLCCLGQQAFAQLEVIGSKEYGRVFDINYDLTVQNRLYAITLGNHIVVSNDNGVNWEVLYSHPEKGTSLKTLRVLPDNKLSFYTNYGSADVLYIMDIATLIIEKQFVLPIPDSSDQEWISNYSIYEANTDIALVLQGYKIGFSNYAKVYYTNDAGATWQEVYFNTPFDEVFPNNVAISPDDPNKLFIARGNGPNDIDGGLFVSADAGTTWEEKIPGNTYDPIAFNPLNPDDILVGTSIGYGTQVENLYRSLDGGNTWNIIPITWTNETLNNITAIRFNPSDPANIIVLEENEVAITHDNFNTVQNFVYPVNDTHGYYYGLTASYNPFNGNEIFVNGNYHALFSANSGETFTWSKNPYFVTTGSVSLTSGTENHLYYGVQFGYVHRDLATGVETPYEVKPLDYMSNSPGITVYSDESIPGRVYSFKGSFMGSNLYMSNDHGATKIQILSLFSNTFNCVETDPANPNIIWAAFSNWGSEVQVYKIDVTDPGNITSTLITLPEADLVTGIIIDNLNSNNVMISQGVNIYKSADGGTTWTSNSTGLEELIPMSDLIMHLAQNLLNVNQFTIASNVGIFTSLDGGASWTKIYSSIIHNLSHSTVANGQIVATTHTSNISDFKIIYSKDGGSSWNEIAPKDLKYVASAASAFRFIADTAEVFIGTTDLGLVKYSIDMNAPNVGIVVNPVNAGEVSVYPNPTAGDLHIVTSKAVLSVDIYNITGQQVFKAFNTISLNITHLETGVYSCKITTTDGKTTVVKVVR